MSPCDKTQYALDEYTLGLSSLDDVDIGHIRSCAECQERYVEAKRLRTLLSDYADSIDKQTSKALASRSWKAVTAKPSYRLRWMAVAAGLLFAFFLGWVWRAQVPPEPGSSYLRAVEIEAARVEILTYLGRSQMFLLSLFDDSIECDNETAGSGFEQEIAQRLIFQKKLLEPKLSSPQFEDLKPTLDELETLLLDVANTQGCVHENLATWREVIESRATLTKLKLLQMEGRI